MAWWSRDRGVQTVTDEKKSVPKGIWHKCEPCQEILFGPDLEENQRVCPKCDHHFPMPTQERIRLIVDEGSFVEEDFAVESGDPLGFRVDGKRYRDRLRAAKKNTTIPEAYRAGAARIGGHEVEIGLFAFEFMGGSMGSAVGERITRQLERAHERRRPAIIFSASGGARMQEGILSLMQMAKTSAALARLRQDGTPYISVLLNPTTGGVAASFAMLGDLIFAEPKALIGFAGPRVIEQTIRQKLPDGFQRSEFLLEHGIIDVIVHRKELRDRLIRTLAWFGSPGRPPTANGQPTGRPKPQ
ncbi:MAG: acetyl-CoA carboxylase carboxyltransferase subunit beta [Deltaproteobacteria bacterium]|nr:acetyl-CoA carboxylase carboxyltransferase subunit beta [Deltaproteobacteria bacterium]